MKRNTLVVDRKRANTLLVVKSERIEAKHSLVIVERSSPNVSNDLAKAKAE